MINIGRTPHRGRTGSTKISWRRVACAWALPLVLAGLAMTACGPRSAALPEARDGSGRTELDLPAGDPALPGLGAGDPALMAALDAARTAQGPDYRPRTMHLLPDGAPAYTNRLIREQSPYLLQHAHNPVNWQPWGDGAFARAAREGKPVLLSIGYSTCHWCHVMEEESFEDLEIAAYLNQHYVAIKVDRELRPDLDGIYMAAVQRLTGRGGWPMTVWLDARRRPFFGGTYFPPRDGDRGTRTGFLTVLRQLRQVYNTQPEEVDRAAGQLTELLREQLQPMLAGGMPGPHVLNEAATGFLARFDSLNGGVQGAPKFPSSMPVRFLLRQHRRTGEATWLRMAERSLEGMAAGGIHDHVGGGFHRYSTDERWLVPHFEKMLYDNALLAMAYLEGSQATGRADFARVARRILGWVERDMSAPEGGFYSATDADSRVPGGGREEGWYYSWTPAELKAVLGEKDAAIVATCYDVTRKGNFEGRSVLWLPRPLDVLARELGRDAKDLHDLLDSALLRLDAARRTREAPLRDEKVLASWNGLMISAFARAGLQLDNLHYTQRAGRAADFVLEHMQREGRLLRTFNRGWADQEAYLDDYAFFIAGLLDLYEATGEPRWLAASQRLDSVLEQHYEEPAGGFFLTSDDHEQVLAREKPVHDGAEPSGNSVQALNLLRLHELSGEDRYRARADRLLTACGQILAAQPGAVAELLLAVEFRLDSPREIVIVTDGSSGAAAPFLHALNSRFLPNRVLVVAGSAESRAAHERVVPMLEGKLVLAGRATAYVCEQGSCKLPTSDAAAFGRQLDGTGPSHAE